MCVWVAAAQGLMSVAGSVMQQNAAEQNAVRQGEAVAANASSAIKQSNWKYADYELNRRDAFDTAVNDLIKLQLQGLQRQGTIDAAINENQSGNTARLLSRNVEGDIARKSASIKDNYDRKGAEIDHNKLSTLESTKDYVKGLKMPEMPDRSAMYLNIGSSIVGAYSTADTIKTQRAIAGKKSTFWG